MKKYKQILLSNDTGERLELQDAPIGWDGMKFNVIRDLIYFGVFKSLSVEFQFVGDGYKFLQKQRLRYGVDADVLYRIYKGNKWLFDGKINFAPSFKEDRKNKRFQVDIIQSSFVQKFQNRENVKLNILNKVSLDRNAITPAESKDALIRGKVIRFKSEFEDAIAPEEPEIYHHIWPFKVKSNDNPDVKEVTASETSNDPDLLITPDNAVYVNTSPLPQEISFKANANVTTNLKGDIQFQVSIVRHSIMVVDENDDIISRIVLGTVGVNEDSRIRNVNYSYESPDGLTLHPGHYLLFICERFKGGPTPGSLVPLNEAEMSGDYLTEISYNSMELNIGQDSIFPDSTHPVFLPHELFTNIIAQITGRDNAVYSPFFGRQDLGYAADGEGAYLAITTGELLRGIPFVQLPDEEGASVKHLQVSTSMREAWTSYNAVFGLGILIQDNRIIIEPKDKLINKNISINLGEVSELMISPANDFLFNSVIAGYPKNEYEKENGRDEFNTETQYTNSLISVKKELDLRSVYYGDGTGIEFARRLSIATTGTADTRYDDKIFFIDLTTRLILLPGGGVGRQLISRRLEGITIANGIISPETAINLRIATGQNLLRWQKYLNIPLHRKEQTYFFQSKKKNASLTVQTDIGISVDGEDLQLSQPAYFLPEERKFKVPITIDSLFQLLANPLGVVNYTYEGESFYDYLIEVNSETEMATSEWRMLGTKPTPVDIEPDAQDIDVLKYGDGQLDYVKYGDGENDVILYQ